MSGKNDGGSADYYQLPAGAAELQDLIEHKAMNFAVGNIFKAAYRLGAENSLSDRSRDLRKIMWFAERELQRLASQDDAAHKAPSLCDDCRNVHECKLFDKGVRATLCVEHRPSPCDSEVDPWANVDLCRKCHNTDLFCDQGKDKQMVTCGDYRP